MNLALYVAFLCHCRKVPAQHSLGPSQYRVIIINFRYAEVSLDFMALLEGSNGWAFLQLTKLSWTFYYQYQNFLKHSLITYKNWSMLNTRYYKNPYNRLFQILLGVRSSLGTLCCFLSSRTHLLIKSTGSTKQAVAKSRHDWKIVYWDVKQKWNETKRKINVDPDNLAYFLLTVIQKVVSSKSKDLYGSKWPFWMEQN